jgi:hypothetical protein
MAVGLSASCRCLVALVQCGRPYSFWMLMLCLLSGSRGAFAQEHLSLDVLAYCRQVYGASAGYYHVRTDVYSWACTLGARRFPVSVPDICVLQYGNDYTAEVKDPVDSLSWGCVAKQVNPWK